MSSPVSLSSSSSSLSSSGTLEKTPSPRLIDGLLSLTLNYYEAIAELFAEKVKDLYPKNIAEQFLNKLPLKAKILDIGCGTGRDAIQFAMQDYVVTGIDFCPSMIRIANRMKEQAGNHLPVNFLKDNILQLETHIEPNSFDGIWANNSLLHIPKSEFHKVLEKIHNLLKKGGIFFIQTKEGYAEGLESDERFDKKYMKYVVHYKLDELRRHLINAGFIPEMYEVQSLSGSEHSFIGAICQKISNTIEVLHMPSGIYEYY